MMLLRDKPHDFSSNIDSLSNSDNLVHDIPAPIPAKPAKITLAIRHAAAYKAKRRKLAKACAIAADKDDNDAYNRVYMPPANAEEEEEEEEGSGDNNSVNSSTSDSANKGEGSSAYKRGKGASRYKDMLLHKQQRVTSYPYSPSNTPYTDIYIYYI
ncbi:hypothetical protein P8C59_000154 [Phyllachora maydis]|uniref:Uncharacterized protein n=1 Tax=Phyllachora maydis TaxID=1825666 RepID=A0AAD9HWM2_9PEZI|nr:hypothetical protein P8C59_000154 [Phyllachora maydis]